MCVRVCVCGVCRCPWWHWQSLNGSDFDTIAAVFVPGTGSASATLLSSGSSPANFTAFAFNDDCDPTVRYSCLSLSVTAGVHYAVSVDGFNGASGTVSLIITSGSVTTWDGRTPIAGVSGSGGSGGSSSSSAGGSNSTTNANCVLAPKNSTSACFGPPCANNGTRAVYVMVEWVAGWSFVVVNSGMGGLRL